MQCGSRVYYATASHHESPPDHKEEPFRRSEWQACVHTIILYTKYHYHYHWLKSITWQIISNSLSWLGMRSGNRLDHHSLCWHRQYNKKRSHIFSYFLYIFSYFFLMQNSSPCTETKPCHAFLLWYPCSYILYSYKWFTNLHVGLEISVTFCRGSRCFCNGS